VEVIKGIILRNLTELFWINPIVAFVFQVITSESAGPFAPFTNGSLRLMKSKGFLQSMIIMREKKGPTDHLQEQDQYQNNDR
jgi:hypothetical protein